MRKHNMAYILLCYLTVAFFEKRIDTNSWVFTNECVGKGTFFEICQGGKYSGNWSRLMMKAGRNRVFRFGRATTKHGDSQQKEIKVNGHKKLLSLSFSIFLVVFNFLGGFCTLINICSHYDVWRSRCVNRNHILKLFLVWLIDLCIKSRDGPSLFTLYMWLCMYLLSCLLLIDKASTPIRVGVDHSPLEKDFGPSHQRAVWSFRPAVGNLQPQGMTGNLGVIYFLNYDV